MIRLELTLEESECLHQWLADPDHPAYQHPLHQQLLYKVAAARQQALHEQTCPICHQSFTQLKGGRSGIYCSTACKQKAYRQRLFESKRRYYPPPR